MEKGYNGWFSKQTWEIVLLQDNTYKLVPTIYRELNPNSMSMKQLKSAIANWWSSNYPEQDLQNVSWGQVTWAFIETCIAENLPIKLQLRVAGDVGGMSI